MKKIRLFLLAIVVMLLLPVGVGAAILDELPLEKGDSGQSVVMLQQRLTDLGYLHFRPTGSYGDLTKSAVAAFQQRNGISSTGVFGENTFSKLYSKGLARAAGNNSIPRIIGPGLQGTPVPGELISWAEVSALFPVGATATVMDYKTQKTYQVTRTGGAHHADASFVGSVDKEAFLSSFGGSQTWEKRPVVLEVAGRRIAGSAFGTLNVGGDVTLYFLDSGSDMGGITDVEHHSNIYLAAGSKT